MSNLFKYALLALGVSKLLKKPASQDFPSTWTYSELPEGSRRQVQGAMRGTGIEPLLQDEVTHTMQREVYLST